MAFYCLRQFITMITKLRNYVHKNLSPFTCQSQTFIPFVFIEPKCFISPHCPRPWLPSVVSSLSTSRTWLIVSRHFTFVVSFGLATVLISCNCNLSLLNQLEFIDVRREWAYRAKHPGHPEPCYMRLKILFKSGMSCTLLNHYPTRPLPRSAPTLVFLQCVLKQTVLLQWLP